MSFVALTTAETAYKAGIGQDLWRKVKDNFDDHESRILQLLAQSHNALVDDFLSSAEGGDGGLDQDYQYDASAGTVTTLVASTGEHVLQLETVATAATRSLRAKNTKCAFRLNQDMAMFFEARVKDPGGTAPDNICVGLQDRAAAGLADDESDLIAFLKGTTAGKWRFRTAKAGVSSGTDNLGNRANWSKLRIEVTRSGSGATFQVRAYIDGGEISGSPFTTNLPDTVILCPTIAIKTPGAGTCDVRMDRWETRWSATPLAA